MNKQNEKIIRLAGNAGLIMMENGAETYRVEDTIERIILYGTKNKAQIFAIPTGIFISVDLDDITYTKVLRSRTSTIDLERISMVNSFARDFCNGDISLEQGFERLEQIENTPIFSSPIRVAAGGISSGFFTLIFGGTILEFILASIVGSIVVYSIILTTKFIKTSMINNIIAGMANTFFALTFVFILNEFSIHPRFDLIIVGSLMPLVPGLSMINAIKDSISGELVSGISRFVEAMIIAIAIAIGVGSILYLNDIFKVVSI
jgi:uncharacterized membrane protein YjjP (DUF1212 family)